MAPKEPTRAQLSSRLAYQSHTPNFLLKFKNRMNGIADDEEEFDEEFEHTGDGREPVPRRPRPPIPERPEGDVGSDEEDPGDEKPQVVVLKEGKHLTERAAENIRRAEKGLPPLPDVDEISSDIRNLDEEIPDSNSKYKSGSSQGLSFSTSTTAKFKSNKRKATSQLDELKSAATESSSGKQKESKDLRSKNPSKKAKKEKKTLLSFGDDT